MEGQNTIFKETIKHRGIQLAMIFYFFSCANLLSLVALGRFGVEKIQSLTSMVSNSVCHGLKGNHTSVKKYLSFQIWVKNGES